MGRGGGHHGGGGGRSGGGWSGGGGRIHFHSFYRSSRNSNDMKSSGAESIIIGATFGLICIGICISFPLFAFIMRPDALCGGITNVNRGEQRVCRPPKTQDVVISKFWGRLTAYRYDIKNLSETEMRTTHWDYQEWLQEGGYKYFDFALLPGGFVDFTYYTIGNDMVDIYVMTLTQFNDFENKKSFKFEWCNKSTSYTSHVFTAKEAGIYLIVVDGKYTSTDVYETVRIRTPAYKLSSSTAKEICYKGCTFKRVGNDEVVILEYLGDYNYVEVKVFSGKGPFDSFSIALIVLSSIFSLFFGACSVVLIYNGVQKKQQLNKMKALVSNTNAPTTIQNETTLGTTSDSATQATITPGTAINDTPDPEPTAPLISYSANDEVSTLYGTAPPPDYV